MDLRFILTSVAFISIFFSNAMTLHTDGVIRVKGGNWRDVKIIVVPEFSTPFEIELSGAHFKLDLPMFSAYLLRAEHPGCPSKAILFDCTVPNERMDANFRFPFEVELEVLPTHETFEYAGPVGLVSFDMDANDFTYSTDYTKIHKMRVLPELEMIMARKMASTATDHKMVTGSPVADIVKESVTNAEDPDANDPNTELAIEVLNALPEEHTSAYEPIVREGQAEGSVHEDQLVTPVGEHPTTDHSPELDPSGTSVPSIMRAEVLPVTRSAPALIESAQCNSHEFVHERRYVIRIDRIGTIDGCMELRKVTHAFGATYYFINGSAATGERYSKAFQQVPDTNENKVYVQN